jgi:hypothetical protein
VGRCLDARWIETTGQRTHTPIDQIFARKDRNHAVERKGCAGINAEYAAKLRDEIKDLRRELQAATAEPAA